MKNFRSLLLPAAALLITAAPAFADSVSYTLLTLNPTGNPGSSISFSGSLSAPFSNTGTVSLLGDSYTVNGPGVLDDTAFFNAPADLAPGVGYAGALFSLLLPTNAAAGTYSGSFDIDVLVNGAQSTLNGPFQYTVASANTVTPEPGTWLLLSTGLAGAAALRRRWLARA